MHRRIDRLTHAFRSLTLFAAAASLAVGPWFALAASKSVDLDGNGTAESVVDLTVVSSLPAKIRNKVTNKAVGSAFTFKWYSAGPGGLSSSVAAGTSTGVGVIWNWATNNTIYSYTGTTCAKDVCFTKTAGTGPTSRGPFSVPGRSLTTTDITVSNASLTSSVITFFSPPQLLAQVTCSVGPSAGGGLNYTTTITNNTNSDLTVDLEPYPPGCCNDAHMLNCDGTCVYYLNDPLNCGACGNVCGEGYSCVSGTCVPPCPEGTTYCNGACVDLMSDPANCGACGFACGSNDICTGGACVTCRPPQQTACNNVCVNIHTDPYNCGACNVNCNFLCPSTGQGTCSQGESCFCTDGSTPASGPAPAPEAPAPAAAPEVTEAPLCEYPGQNTTIPAGGSLTTCETRSVLAREVPTVFAACGEEVPDGDVRCANGEPATAGTFMCLVPDMTAPIGDAYVTPLAMEVDDSSGDGLLSPGEFARLKIQVNNAGPMTITGVSATLTSPPVDLTEDGSDNPVGITIPVATSAYQDIVGYPTGSGDCSQPAPPVTPASNTIWFEVQLPSDHPGDVARPFSLHVTGTIASGPFAMDVPFNVGITGLCDPTAIDGNYDGIDGLLTPMAPLVPEGETVPLPDKPFQQGKTRPLKMRLLCGGVNLRGGQIAPPEIVGLSEATRGPIDITTISLNDGANPQDPFFSFNEKTQQWNFSLRTTDLAKGAYTLKIRVAERKDYVTGFVLN